MAQHQSHWPLQVQRPDSALLTFDDFWQGMVRMFCREFLLYYDRGEFRRLRFVWLKEFLADWTPDKDWIVLRFAHLYIIYITPKRL